MESIAAERLNKIGKNPSLVSQREDLQTDLKAVNELITLSTMSAQSLDEDSDSDKNLMLTIKKALPRPKSETCFKLGPVYNNNTTDPSNNNTNTPATTSTQENNNTYNTSNTYDGNNSNNRSPPHDRPRTHSTFGLKP